MDAPPYLGVESSLSGRRWRGPGPEVERTAEGIAQATGLPGIVARLLAVAGVPVEAAEGHLAPTLRDLMPDPSTLAGMDEAAERLCHAVTAGQKVAIFGDYDVDGGASVALLAGWVVALGVSATTYIPDRIDEGYGPNAPAMAALGREHDLIVCVDCGTLSHEPIAAARAAGADVIVADHHLPGPELPDAIVVNPNRADDASGLGHLCAAGVVFLLLVACNRALRNAGHFGGGRAEPDLMAMLDLVAVASVADVAPMIGLNRAFVRQGLAAAVGDRLGLCAGAADKRGRADRRGRSGRAAADDHRSARGRGAGRETGEAER